MPHLVKVVRNGAYLTGERVRGYALILLVSELTLFFLVIAGTYGWITKLDQPASSDFVSYYAAGMLANSDRPALAYDPAAHHAAEQLATEAGIAYNYFYYPPVYLLLCAPLARLPYLVAFVLLQALGLLPCIMLARQIVGYVPSWVLVAFPAVFWSIGTGQNALLTAALLATATLILDRRPILAGVVLGTLCYKPHFGLLLPIALAAGGNWRTLAAAAAAATALMAASALAFGWDTWRGFLTAAQGADAIYATKGAIDLAGLTSLYGLVLELDGSRALAITLQAAVSLGAAAAVALIWRRGAPLPVRAAVLLAAMPVAVPVMMFYDLMITGLALAWLVRAGREGGFPEWQQTGLAVLFLLPLLSGNTRVQFLFPPAAATLGFILALRQAAPYLSTNTAMAKRPAEFPS